MSNVIKDTDLQNIIEMRGIGQSYDGGQNWIIKNLDFVVEDKPDQGQFAVILGMSGSGKSTVLRYICLLYTSPSPRDRTRSRMPSSA